MSLRKCATKFRCAKTVSGKVVGPGLSNHAQMVVGDVPLNVNFLLKTPTVVAAANACDARKHQGNLMHILLVSQRSHCSIKFIATPIK